LQEGVIRAAITQVVVTVLPHRIMSAPAHTGLLMLTARLAEQERPDVLSALAITAQR